MHDSSTGSTGLTFLLAARFNLAVSGDQKTLAKVDLYSPVTGSFFRDFPVVGNVLAGAQEFPHRRIIQHPLAVPGVFSGRPGIRQ